MAKRKTTRKRTTKEPQKWIAGATENEGAPHRELGVPEGEKIPASKLKVKPGDTLRTKRRKIAASNLRAIARKRKAKAKP